MKVDVKTPPFRVVILYGSLSASTRAFEVFERLIDLFGGGYVFQNRLFRLDSLLLPAFARPATHDTSQADMIIVSTGDERELTPDFRIWALAWPPTAVTSDRVLVALLDKDLGVNGRAESRASFLRELAARHGMDFISNVERNDAPHGRAASLMAGLTEVELPIHVVRCDKVVISHQRRIHTSRSVQYARWGLNE